MASEHDNTIWSVEIELADKSTLIRALNYLASLELSTISETPESKDEVDKIPSDASGTQFKHSYDFRPREEQTYMAANSAIKFFVLTVILCLTGKTLGQNDNDNPEEPV